MSPVAVYRRDGPALVELDRGANGYLCSEGQMIVLRTHTEQLPKLFLCGAAIPTTALDPAEGGYVAEFERLIDMWAGRTLFVLHDGERRHDVQLDIGPHEGKLAAGDWEAMIRELSAVAASLPWGLSAGGAGGRMTRDALANVHPAIIEQELPRLLQMLRSFLAEPPLRTSRTRTLRPLDTSRRVDLRTVRWLAQRPAELAGVRGQTLEGEAPNSRALADQPETVTSLDHPVTRYFAFLLLALLRRLRLTSETLKRPTRHARLDPAVGVYAGQLAARVDRSAADLDRVLRHRVFRAVAAEAMTDAVLQSLPDHPLYAAIHRTGRRLLEPGLAYAPGQDLSSALKHSYDLFELLVLYRLGDALNAELPAGWQQARVGDVVRLDHEDRPDDEEIWSWDGPEGLTLQLVYQAEFPSVRVQPRERSSLSSQRVPDYILVLRRAGAVEGWVILDAKYRTSGRSIDEGLGDIHRYRDALRLAGRRADAAFIVAPQVQLEAAVYTRPDYIVAHRFGVLSVYAESWVRPILEQLGMSNPSS